MWRHCKYNNLGNLTMEYHNKESRWKNEECIVLFQQPFWEDACNHPKESYVGSAIFKEKSQNTHKEPKIDVYVFDTPSSQRVCIRYANDPSAYASPGTLLDFLLASQQTPHMPDYAAAALVIDHFMQIQATKKK